MPKDDVRPDRKNRRPSACAWPARYPQQLIAGTEQRIPTYLAWPAYLVWRYPPVAVTYLAGATPWRSSLNMHVSVLDS
ncbi:hypothetical protein CGCVW01_v002942 [Colletotrichum viniferum]|nr:hypothetical protein CGCVW01_v002942 [Colletotrichum viniferum]